MTRNELDGLIRQGEHSRLEFKRQLSSAARIARTLAAFANSAGGIVLIGVADDGKIIGVASEFREVAIIEEATEQLIQPALTISYKTLAPDGRIVLIVTILESDEKPHYVIQDKTKRTIYIRAKDKSVPTNKLIYGSEPANAELLQSPTVRTLHQYLRKNDHITAERFAKLVNISDYRAGKLLRQLAERGFVLLIDKSRPVRYVLKLGE
ncbi:MULTISPECIES: helix-turn-helix domain-containing protein [unclassified Spirosoma]|uniref:AlbA family DNA-binding domain-containing protein n=1 Tax=unclassified Spirosoma TaxID=2621999 RepID=UPI0009630213|nr:MULTISPECIES: ATP-binding protein [unclassified Spirosoma]MBN8825665.1 ATP-binding protein [Spirosoma sp.]OJW71636.1 MAG: ATP-binding protein [Spirosoma sp. 48-14]